MGTNITSIPVPVSFAAVVGYNGKIYIMGGFNTTGTVIATTQIYDVATDTCSTGADMSNARANHSAVEYDGKIYVKHGTTGNATTAWAAAGTPLNTLIYTISSNTWASTGVVDSSQSNRGVVLVDDTIYYMGGKSAASTFVNTLDGLLIQYNALTTAVTELSMSAVRTGFSAVTFTDNDGYPNILVMGGTAALTNTACNPLNSPAGMTTTTFINSFQYLRYPFTTPQQIAWTSLTNLPASLGFGSAVISGKTLYYFGGAAYSTATTVSAQNVVYSYNLDLFPSGNWTIHDVVMPHLRFGHTAVTVDYILKG
jgi:hypothetical protein